MTDPISSAIQLALGGLSDRRRVIDDNISNVQTPGFLSGQTDFESSLKAALEGRQNVSTSPRHFKSLSPTRIDGNNVDLDNETVSAIDTNLRYQALVEAMNHKYRNLRSAMGVQ